MLKRTLLASLAICALSLSASVTHADAPIRGDGTLSYGPPVLLDSRTVGQTTFIDVDIDGTITGLLDGTIGEQYTVKHHATAGFNTYRGVLVFEGTVTDRDGIAREGTLTLQTHGRQDPGMPFPTAVPWYMQWVIVDGSGGLEHVQGHGTGVLTLEPFGFALAYEGQVHFSGR